MDKAGPPRDLPEHDGDADRGAERRPEGICTPTYAEFALKLLDQGYEPLPIRTGSKAPVPSRWSSVRVDQRQVEAWVRQFPSCGIGLRTGHLVGVDIDIYDADIAHQIGQLAEARLGATLIRVGRWPKRLYLYRTGLPFAKLAVPGLEILGRGQQFVALGIHPTTGQPYYWPYGDTPLDVTLDRLPLIDEAMCQAFLAEAQALLPTAVIGSRRANEPSPNPGPSAAPTRDADGRVVDGRDGWLSTIAFHCVHDAQDTGRDLEAAAIAETVWNRFVATTDLSRPKQGCRRSFDSSDAARKVSDKLRLLQDGHLAGRTKAEVPPDYAVATLSVEDARDALAETLSSVCNQIFDWHAAFADQPAPQIGIRATVGLGKSAASRAHLLKLQPRLAERRLPSKIAVFVPSHALAEETASEWRNAGAKVAVLRGYEAQHPVHKKPMCRDIDLVKLAILNRTPVRSTACEKKQARCPYIETCLKQQNLQEVEHAEVVVAPFDALYSGFGISAGPFGAVLIDEGCWSRAIRETKGLIAETIAAAPAVTGLLGRKPEQAAAKMADLVVLRSWAGKALVANGPGAVWKKQLIAAGLTAELCDEAAELELGQLQDAGLFPGVSASGRRMAAVIARQNDRAFRMRDLWRALADLLGGPAEQDGKLRLLPPDPKTGLHHILMSGLQQIHSDFAAAPILHLDATLRPDLAKTIMTGLEVITIDAAMPHMSLTLISGSFGKTTLCQQENAAEAENRRRANRLAECVDYVRWQALRADQAGVLVVTYMDCEAAFGGIPNVQTAHFNAIAGLDVYRDVGTLIVIGRPLPPSAALQPFSGAFFGQEPSGEYGPTRSGIWMREGTNRVVKAVRHQDEHAEVLRAAICDDEVIQAIGRGRGVNRTARNPLEVHVLADVALPLVHDRIISWSNLVPDIVQRMLLAGLGVDSPADATRLHPGLFETVTAADHALRRSGFNRQNPIGNIYREMAVKSACYRTGGKGRSRQFAYWVVGSAAEARVCLEAAIGHVAEWIPRP